MTYRYCFDCELMPHDRCVHQDGLRAATPTTPACPLFRAKNAPLVAPPEPRGCPSCARTPARWFILAGRQYCQYCGFAGPVG